MNIFYLDECPVKSAVMQCDKHVVKMILESAQMLCTALHEKGIEAPYKSTHKNHPCSIWARQSDLNYAWLYEHMVELANEYTRRYNKTHKTSNHFEFLKPNFLYTLKDLKDLPPPPQCMPDEHKRESTVEAYRQYYIKEKSYMAKWKHHNQPEWFPLLEDEKINE